MREGARVESGAISRMAKIRNVKQLTTTSYEERKPFES